MYLAAALLPFLAFGQSAETAPLPSAEVPTAETPVAEVPAAETLIAETRRSGTPPGGELQPVVDPLSHSATGQRPSAVAAPGAEPRADVIDDLRTDSRGAPLEFTPPNSLEPPLLPATPPELATPRSQPQPPADAAAPPEQTPSLRRTTPELVADELALPTGSKLAGRSITLLEAVSSTVDRRTQTAVVHAYWDLAEAVAAYRGALHYDDLLKRRQVAGHEALSWQAAVASSAAHLQQAEATVVGAQHELAALISQLGDRPLPLPADPPHVGPYRTEFDRLFSARVPPAVATRIDRTLPIRRQAIESRAAAVVAARMRVDAALADSDANPNAGGAPFGELARRMENDHQQRRTLMTLVCRYNHDIADYVLAVAHPGVHGRDLVRMLIDLPPEPLRPIASAELSGVRPVEYRQPFANGQRTSSISPSISRANVPTPAVRQPTPAAPDRIGPAGGRPAATPATRWSPASPSDGPAGALAPRRPAVGASGTLTPTPAASTTSPESDRSDIVPGEPPATGTFEKPVSGGPTRQQPPPLVPAPQTTDAADPVPWTARKPATSTTWVPAGRLPRDGNGASTANTLPSGPTAAERALNPSNDRASRGMAADAQTASIVPRLYATLQTHQDGGDSIDLAKCLQQQVDGQPGPLIYAFWRAGGWAAREAELRRHANRLDELASSPVVLARSSGVLWLAAARMAATADADAAQVEMVEAQYELAVWLGRVSQPAWPLPTTVPRWQPYPMAIASHPENRPVSWQERRLLATLPQLAETVQQRAAAVTAAEAARTAATGHQASAAPSAGESLEVAIDAADRQTAETIALLDALTAYNGAIADYVLLTTPADTPSDRLASAILDAE